MMREANIESIKSAEERERLDQGQASSSNDHAAVNMDMENDGDAEMSANEVMSLTGNAQDANDMLSWSNLVASIV